jgi:hypothetical protein
MEVQLRLRFVALEKEYESSVVRVTTMERRMIRMEQHSRKSNARISGLAEAEGEDCAAVVAEMFKMRLDFDK